MDYKKKYLKYKLKYLNTKKQLSGGSKESQQESPESPESQDKVVQPESPESPDEVVPSTSEGKSKPSPMAERKAWEEIGVVVPHRYGHPVNEDEWAEKSKSYEPKAQWLKDQYGIKN